MRGEYYLVFITKGPCCTIGSPMGRPATSTRCASSAPGFSILTAAPALDSSAVVCAPTSASPTLTNERRG